LKEDEMLVVVSDGVTQAGLGGILPLGLGIEGLALSIKNNINLQENAQKIANQVIELCQAFYTQEIGDDTTALVVKFRQSREAVVFTGPPINRAQDSAVVRNFIEKKARKIVCGGTTANIVARETKQSVFVNFDYIDPLMPPHKSF